MKVDEFITIYKLLTEQSFYTLPFCLLGVYGLLDLMFGIGWKRIDEKRRGNYGRTYALLLIASLVTLILKRDADENLRKDALRIKQYMEMYAGDYYSVCFSKIKENVRVDTCRIKKIADMFPDDFVVVQPPAAANVKTADKKREECLPKMLVLKDPKFTTSNKHRLEMLALLKMRGLLAVNNSQRCDYFMGCDNRITPDVVETVCTLHPDEFVIDIDWTDHSNFRGYFRRIK